MAKLLFILGYACVCLLLDKAGVLTNIGPAYVGVSIPSSSSVVNIQGPLPLIVENEQIKEESWSLRLQKLQASNLLTDEIIERLDHVYEVSNLTYAKKQSELIIATVFRDKLQKITSVREREKCVNDVEKYSNTYWYFVKIITMLETELKSALDNGLITIYYQRKIQEEINEKLHILKTTIKYQ